MKNYKKRTQNKVRLFKPFITEFLRTVALIGLLGIISSCMEEDLEVRSDIQEEFDGINSVIVEGGLLPVSYKGRPEGTVLKLEAFLKANVMSRSKIVYEINGDLLIIQVKSSGGSMRKADGFIHLEGPEKMVLDLNATLGEVTAENVKGDLVKLSINSGKITANNIESSEIQYYINSGIISGQDLTGSVRVNSTSANIEFRKVQGNLVAEGSSGTLQVFDLSGKVDAKMNTGEIEMERVKEIGIMAVKSGKITGRQAGLGAFTNLSTNSGSIKIQTHSILDRFNYDISASSGIIQVGNSQSLGTLKINNNSPNTVKGQVGSGILQITN